MNRFTVRPLPHATAPEILQLRALANKLPADSRSEQGWLTVALMEPPAVRFVAEDRGQLVGAALGLTSRGGMGMVHWPFAVDPSYPDAHAVAAQLLAHLLASLRAAGQVAAFALISEERDSYAAPPDQHGFARITTLVYFSRTSERLPAKLPTVPIRIASWDQASPQLLERVMTNTYADARDCPELEGLRSAEQTLCGYEEIGGSGRKHWKVLCFEDEPIGVMLLAEILDEDALELIYLGILPGYRGRGWGRWALQQALALAHTLALKQLTLAVDSRNQPALRLYQSLGFQERGRRVLYLRPWSELAPAPSEL